MVTKELVQDNYITELRQIGGLVDKYQLSHQYVGTISASPNYQTDEITIEELSTFRQEHALISGSATIIVFRQQPAPVREELLAHEGRNEEVATFPKIVQEKGVWVRSVAERSDTALTSGSVMEELKEFLRRQAEDWFEVYPGYRVSYAEYRRRFKGVDLDHFQKVLPPELFKAYVRTMGSIEGWGIKPKNRFKGKD